MLNKQAFETFETSGTNDVLISQEKYGILLYQNNELIPTQITETDFVLYDTVNTDLESNSVIMDLFNKIEENQYFSWPIAIPTLDSKEEE